jgi:hypothetical protein
MKQWLLLLLLELPPKIRGEFSQTVAGFLGVAILLVISTKGRLGVTPALGVPIKERSDTEFRTLGLR